MARQADDSKPNGYSKQCRDCDRTIYLHRGPSGPWRAYESSFAEGAEAGEWVRHRCPSALQDAEIMGIISPAGSKPLELVPRLKRLIKDFEHLISQAPVPDENAAPGRPAAAPKTPPATPPAQVS